MNIMKKEENNFAFIDSQNVYKGTNKLAKRKSTA